MSRGTGRFRLVAATLVAVAGFLVGVGQALASAGCDAVNAGGLDATGAENFSGSVNAVFGGGETLQITFTGMPTSVWVTDYDISSSPIWSGTAPTSTSYVIPSSGSRLIAATWGGGSSGTNTITATCTGAPAPTVTSITPDSGPTTGGTSVTISGSGFSGTDTVSFGSTAATSFTVDSATSITATSPAGSGTVDITVTTGGGSSATSAADQFTYTQQVPTVGLSSSANPVEAGSPVTFTATVSGTGLTPTGTVIFTIDGTNFGSVAIDASGDATFIIDSLAVGSHTVTATYSGDVNYAGETTSPVTQVVNAVATGTAVTSSQNPSSLGDDVTFTAAVTGGSPTGTVTFSVDGSDVASNVPLVSGQASFTTNSLAAGSRAVVATYSGDIIHATSSGSLTQTVNALGTVTIVVTTDGTGGTFGFTMAPPSLNLSIAAPTGTGQSAPIPLAAGTYTISAASAAEAGFALTGITCSDGSPGDASSGTATIELAAGENLTCTFAFTNSRSATTELIEDFFDTRAELILSHGPNSQRRIDRLNGIAPSPGDPASALMGLMPLVSGGGPRALSGSLGAIEQAVADPAEPAAFDIWFETTFGAYGSDAAKGEFGIAYLGADYLVSSDLLIGALFQLDRVGFDSNTGDATAEGTGWMIGPYVTGRLGDNLYIDLRAAAGRSANSVSPFGTYTDEVDASRWLIEAAISGEWTDGTWTFQPAARLSYFEETSDAYTDGLGVYVPSVTSGTGQLALGPALSYRFVTDGEIDVVLGAALDGVLDFSLDGGAPAADGAHADLEASIDLSLPGGARLGAAIKAGGLGENDFRFLSGTVSVSAAIQ